VLNTARGPLPAPAGLTLDLDDTLWPIGPVIERCEQVLHAFLGEHAPPVAQRFPGLTMRALRDRIHAERPELGHDYGALRRLSLEHAFAECELHAPDTIEAAYTLFYATRNQVELYAEIGHALPALAARQRIVALTNGNADLAMIGLDHHFHGAVFAREVGCAKPDRRIFDHACALLEAAPASVWHVGDDPDLDVVGAHRAGMTSVWLNRDGRRWPYPDGPLPDLVVRDLAQLDTWIASCR
jgi:putative hydrolase of the HAD superfamily